MTEPNYPQLAAKYNLSVDAVRHLHQALQRGNGSMAQFNHPELGGSGQWMPGMVMVGDMFNTALKAKVDGLVADLAATQTSQPMSFGTMPPTDAWWDPSLGQPSSAGSQNDLAYAYFRTSNRLAIRYGGRVRLYDTTGHTLTGIMAQQSNTRQNLRFSTTNGPIHITEFTLLTDNNRKS